MSLAVVQMPKDPVIEAFISSKMESAVSVFYDMLGFPRPGREPDYLNGRWCVKCHNSLSLDWKGPCDVCGSETSFPAGARPRRRRAKNPSAKQRL